MIEGIKTTIPFHQAAIATPAFRAGDVYTDFIEQNLPEFLA